MYLRMASTCGCSSGRTGPATIRTDALSGTFGLSIELQRAYLDVVPFQTHAEAGVQIVLGSRSSVRPVDVQFAGGLREVDDRLFAFTGRTEIPSSAGASPTVRLRSARCIGPPSVLKNSSAGPDERGCACFSSSLTVTQHADVADSQTSFVLPAGTARRVAVRVEVGRKPG